MHSARDHGHIFSEAFMLMRYACDACGHNEMIWNSRDGITPFSVGCRKCNKLANHIDWEGDIYAPDFRPQSGARIFSGPPDNPYITALSKATSEHDPRCNCPLPYRGITPEEHEESCPVVNPDSTKESKR